LLAARVAQIMDAGQMMKRPRPNVATATTMLTIVSRMAPRTDTYRSPRGPKKNASTNVAPTLPCVIEPSSLHPFEGEPEDLVRELQIDVLSSLRVAVGEYENLLHAWHLPLGRR
jgi:hypothetical protein